MAADRRLGKFWVAISPKRVIQSTSCLVLWRDFRDWRIDRRLRFDQIQDDAHGRHMCHKVLHYPENSSPMNASQCSARFTGSHHEYTLSEPSAVVNSTDWLQLTPTDSTYTVRTIRFFITWKTVLPWTPVSILAVLLDHTMNTLLLSQVHWNIVLTDSIWTAFDPWNMLHPDNKAPQHLERRFCHKGKSTFGPLLLDQTMNKHFLSPLQWLILLHGSTWEPFHPWKTPYHVQQVYHNASQYSSRFYWITPWIHTF